jgi:negative regulator of sigma F NrsF-like protein
MCVSLERSNFGSHKEEHTWVSRLTWVPQDGRKHCYESEDPGSGPRGACRRNRDPVEAQYRQTPGALESVLRKGAFPRARPLLSHSFDYSSFPGTGLRRTQAINLPPFSQGLVAGAIGATVYSFSCPSDSWVFVFLGYSDAVALCSIIGAQLGPRLLRW